MRHLFPDHIFIRHPAKYLTTTVIIKVHINIRQRDTVGFEKRSNSKSYWIGSIFVIPRQYATAEPGRRSTSRTYGYTQLLAGSIDKVLHNQEVSGETHSLHDISPKFMRSFHFFRQGSPYIRFAPSTKPT